MQSFYTKMLKWILICGMQRNIKRLKARLIEEFGKSALTESQIKNEIIKSSIY
jgi:hypothetical protein